MPEQSWLGDLYRQFRRPLFLTAWNVLGCTGLAEDAVHSAFVRLARLHEPPREPKLYVFRAVRNAALDAAKARTRRREESFLEAADQASAEDLPGETHRAVEAALERLDPLDHEVVELKLHAGLSFQEIGMLLEQPLPTVASRYRRALVKLRQMLEVHHE